MNNLLERAHKLLRELNNRKIVASAKITDIAYLPCDYKTNNVLPERKDMLPFGGKWGGKNDTHAWFLFEVDVADVENCHSEIFVDSGVNGWDLSNPQFLVYLDGKMAQGLDTNHRSFAVGTGCHQVCLYAYAGYQISTEFAQDLSLQIFDYNNPLSLDAQLNIVDDRVEKLSNDIFVLLNALSVMPQNTKQHSDVLNFVNTAFNLVDFTGVTKQPFGQSCKAASDYLWKEFFHSYCKGSDVSVSCIGHTHLDIAWLWPKRQTREKVQRSFATVLSLMDKYPDYKFMSSQGYLYQAIAEEAPELFEKIKQRVAEGRWDVEGAMWVEADCNLTSGESLVRQILYGKRFMKKHFGVDSKILWLPDVFGYSAALPQILKKCGVETFVTSKISWNDTNVMPYDMFKWKGMDGSEVFTYFLTAPADADNPQDIHTNYNAIANPVDFLRTYNRMQQKALTNEVLMDYGYGDGGGGPTAQFIENIYRMQCGVPTFPVTKFERASDFFGRLRQNVIDNKQLPRWTGELYLEYHRGTYTSIAKNKRNNRRAEYLLQNLEKLFVLARNNGVEYPRKWFADAWQTVLTNQFHDIIPGSAITEVYNVTDEEYAKLFAEGQQLFDSCTKQLAKKSPQKSVLNFNSMVLSGYVEQNGEFVFVDGAQGNGISVANIVESNHSVSVGEYCVENQFYRVEFDQNYDISQIIDKRVNRSLLSKTAKYCCYEDLPNMYDAWEIRNYYKEKKIETQFVAAENVQFGGKCGKRITKRVGDSVITTDVMLYDYIDRLDFDTVVDWKNPHLLLRVEFPLDINSQTATCDVQFGNVSRPTTANTSWEQAKFEFCAHKYVDISDGDFGVALLNDCKYGYSAQDNVLALTLIKCSSSPNDCLDMCEHKFTYALCSHSGSVQNSNVYRHACLLNNPLILLDGQTDGTSQLVLCNADNVIVDTIKLAEDSNDVVVRLFENGNSVTNCRLTFGFDVVKAYKCDMLENVTEEIAVNDGGVDLTLKPFEIVTLKLK